MQTRKSQKNMSRNESRLQVLSLMILLSIISLTSAKEIGRFNSGNKFSKVNAASNRINGGSVVPPMKHTYMAYLITFSETIDEYGSTQVTTRLCGGTLISEGLVLSAAHCFEDPNYVKTEVYLGVQTVEPMDSNYILRTVSKKDTIAHKGYNKAGQRENDIAILRLSEDVDLEKYKEQVSVISLPASNDKFVGLKVTAVGWGKTSTNGDTSPQLLEVDLTVSSKEECEEHFGSTYDHELELCNVPSISKGTCGGDSGGPVLDDDGIQIGIISYTLKDRCEQGGVYTRISASIANNWIQNSLKGQWTLVEEQTEMSQEVGIGYKTNFLQHPFYMQPILGYIQPFFYV